MKVCNACGTQLPDDSVKCTNCGNNNIVTMSEERDSSRPLPVTEAPVKEHGFIGWGILGFFFPLVGWILYYVWRNSQPANARLAGIGGIVGFVVSLALQIIFKVILA